MKRVVISSVLTLLILLLVAAGFFYYKRASLFRSDPISAVPPDAAIVLSGNHAGKMLGQLFRNEAWQSLGHASGGSTVGFIDSLFRGGPAGWDESKLVLSVHMTKAGSFDCLFLVPARGEISDASMTQRVEKFTKSPSQSRRYENVTIHECRAGSRTLAFAVSEGIFLCSFTSFLVEDAIRQLKSGTSVDRNPAFRSAISGMAEGESTCYFNYAGMSMLTASLGGRSAEPITQALSSFAGWSAMEANLQRHSVLLSGYTAAADSNQMAALFSGQSPVVSTLQEIVPGRTAFLLSFGFSQSVRFFASALGHPSLCDDIAARRAAIAQLNRTVHADVEEKMTSWIGSHMSLLVTESGDTRFNNNTYLCLEAARTEDARKKLDAFRRQVNRETGWTDKQETYRDHVIGFINIPDLAPLIFGKPFSRLGKFYYTFVRNYVVAANTASALRSFIDDYEDGKTLAEFPPAKESLSSLSNAHNLFVYMYLPALHNVLRAYGLAAERRQEGSLLEAFTTLSFSLARRGNNLQTSLLWNRIPGEMPGIRLIASARLDTAVTMQPCVFAIPGKDQHGVAVQDAANTLYLLDETGEVLWKKPMSEPVLGAIHAVDYFRNGDVQLFFNTASAMHLVSMDGSYTGNYPIRLPSPAIAGATVIPADARGPERLYIVCRNGQVYAYEISGKPLANWSYGGTFSGMEHSVLPYSTGGKNYLLLYNSNGDVKSLDESGAETALWTAHPLEGLHGSLKVISADSSHPAIVCGLDGRNRIVTLSGDGKIKTAGSGSDSTVYDFSVWPGPGNETVYLTNGPTGIRAFDEAGTERFMKPLTITAASFFQETSPADKEALFADGQGKIFLLKQGGEWAAGFPVKGNTAVGMSAPDPVSGSTWVTGDADGTLYFYEMH